MNLNQLETFVAISKTMSFRKAGEMLNLTQPAVSAQIKSLEEQFGAVLIDRSHPVTLTDNGKVFLEHAEQILNIVGELKQRLADLNETPQGHIHLGTTSSIAMQILPRILSYIQNQYPLIKITIHSMPSSQIFDSVDSGTIDIGIAYLFEHHPNLESSVLYYDSFEFVVSPEHPLASLDETSIESLQDIPLVMLTADTAARRFIDQLFDRLNIIPNVIMEVSSSEEVKRMVELNLGASIISHLSAAREIERGTLCSVKVQELDIHHPVGVVYKSRRYINNAMRQLLNDLQAMSESEILGDRKRL